MHSTGCYDSLQPLPPDSVPETISPFTLGLQTIYRSKCKHTLNRPAQNGTTSDTAVGVDLTKSEPKKLCT